MSLTASPVFHSSALNDSALGRRIRLSLLMSNCVARHKLDRLLQSDELAFCRGPHNFAQEFVLVGKVKDC
jgi:hypothetical protein